MKMPGAMRMLGTPVNAITGNWTMEGFDAGFEFFKVREMDVKTIDWPGRERLRYLKIIVEWIVARRELQRALDAMALELEIPF